VLIRTFGKLSSPAELYDKCLSLSESLANDLRDERLVVSNPFGVFQPRKPQSMSVSLIADLRPEGRIANEMQVK